MVVIDALRLHELAGNDRLGMEVTRPGARAKNQADGTSIDGALAWGDVTKGIGVETQANDGFGRRTAGKPCHHFGNVLGRLAVGRTLVGLTEHGTPEPAFELLALRAGLSGFRHAALASIAANGDSMV